jgi:hypothetical protein
MRCISQCKEWDEGALNAMPFLRMMEFGKKYSLNMFNEIRNAFYKDGEK